MCKVLEEEKFSFQRTISKFVLEHDILLDLVLNLDQTPLSYVSSGKYAFDLKGSTTFSIKDVGNKRQITAAFTVSVSGFFLPIQLIYNDKTKRCLPKYHFPNCFNVTFTPNYWSVLKRLSACLRKLFFPI